MYESLNEIQVTVGAQQAAPSWIDKFADVAKGALSLKQQHDLQKMNMLRISQGLPAIEADALATRVKVGIDQAQLNKILIASGAIALILGALVILRRKK